ncbi:ABC transporter ATP-binding protein [Paenibacillus sp. N1-5-1-14]|uniref:ABC transporter ATP-binding protein n=1 Tax=Paenibacillus radicibacter TaxID=2972488 RepID=UPI002159607C|nr:ABC transporter ATP-binding protein [Paenibacillus radicibacter]MCR8643310.1 ABC transporter ATP-binding protein [Paenibacillus radicibacter]
MIVFQNVSKKHANGYRAVKSLNFEIKAGEFIVLIGPSGCGKTTTMKMMNRLMNHTEGVITIDGKDISKQNPVELRRNIGYVIQQVGLFPHYTIADNIALIPDLKGWSKEKKKERVHELLQMVGLDPDKFAHKYPKQLSGGQQQRVGVARALAAESQIILMDEPFGALDPITREQLQDEFIRLQKTLNKTIIFVTHDIDEALKMGDRIAIMKDGELIQMDTPEQLLNNPVNSFVEEFLGKNRIYQNPAFITVSDIMRQNPVVASSDLVPSRAFAQMRQRRTDTLIVVDEQGRFEGIVSAYELQQHMNEIATIREVIKDQHFYLEQSATAQDALMNINDAKQGIIPIVTGDMKVTGVVTRASLLTTFADHWAGKREENLDESITVGSTNETIR